MNPHKTDALVTISWEVTNQLEPDQRADDENQFVKITIKDNGIGLKKTSIP